MRTRSKGRGRRFPTIHYRNGKRKQGWGEGTGANGQYPLYNEYCTTGVGV